MLKLLIGNFPKGYHFAALMSSIKRISIRGFTREGRDIKK